jgi:molybdenum cofactor cytidylyltransferase
MVGSVEGIVLAAGLSTRMGRAKLVMQVGGVPILARVVGSALKSNLNAVTLVLPPKAEGCLSALGSIADHPRLLHVVNLNPELGMSSSLRVGLAAVRGTSAGAMIILADQPWLRAQVIDQLVGVFLQAPTKIVVPKVHGRRTTPVIFPAVFFPQLMNETGDVGGRNVLNKNRDRIVTCEVGGSYDDADIDTPEDLKKLR